MSRVLEAIFGHARGTPAAIALSDDHQALTYAQLNTHVEATAKQLAVLAPLIRPGAPVAVTLENGLAWVIVDLALIRLGWPSLPIPAFFTAEQSDHAVADAGASLLIAHADGPALLEVAGSPIRVTPVPSSGTRLHVGTAKVTYTSGSTGQPKGVCLSLTQMEDVATSLVTVIGAQYAGVHMPILPLSILLENVAGLYATLLAGGRYHVLPPGALGLEDSFKPHIGRLVEAIGSAGATSLIFVPELLRALIMAMSFTGARLPKLELVAVGGAKVSRKLLDQAEAVGLPVFEGYGLSECASVVALNTPASRREGSVGRILPHLAVVIERGEIVVGPKPFLGYAGGAPCAGPVATGDLGHLDDDGFLYVDGRRSNLIITAFGRNVAPEWVESELLSQTVIRQAVVFGEAQAGLSAIIVPLTPEVGSDAIEQAVERANQSLPAYAQIRRWLVRPPFDRDAGELTGNGRPRRAPLMARHRDFIESEERL